MGRICRHLYDTRLKFFNFAVECTGALGQSECVPVRLCWRYIYTAPVPKALNFRVVLVLVVLDVL